MSKQSKRTKPIKLPVKQRNRTVTVKLIEAKTCDRVVTVKLES